MSPRRRGVRGLGAQSLKLCKRIAYSHESPQGGRPPTGRACALPCSTDFVSCGLSADGWVGSESKGAWQALPALTGWNQTMGTAPVPTTGRGAAQGCGRCLRLTREPSVPNTPPTARVPELRLCFRWRVSGRVRVRDDSGIFWSELKIERKKEEKKSTSTKQNEDKATGSALWFQALEVLRLEEKTQTEGDTRQAEPMGGSQPETEWQRAVPSLSPEGTRHFGQPFPRLHAG